MRMILILFMLKVMVVLGEVQLKYSPPSDSREREARERLLESKVLDDAVELVNSEIDIEEKLLILAGEGDFVHSIK